MVEDVGDVHLPKRTGRSVFDHHHDVIAEVERVGCTKR